MPANVFNLIGEIQFGNWAMVYKDMFRLVSAINKKAKIDLYIYVVADGELLKLMSDNIVNFKDACKRFKENVENHNINKPVIILPLDVDFKVAEYDFSEAEIGYKRICDEIQNCEKKIAYYKNRIKVFRSEKKGLKQDKLKRKTIRLHGPWHAKQSMKKGYKNYLINIRKMKSQMTKITVDRLVTM